MKQAKATMLHAMQADFKDRFHTDKQAEEMWIQVAYSGTDRTEAEAFKAELQALYPNHEIVMDPLSLSVSCHIGPGALAIACTKKLAENK